MKGNAITIGVLTAAAVVSFLLAQPDATFSPTVKLVLGAVNVALAVLARFLPSQGQPIPVQVQGAVPVTPVDDGAADK